MGLRILVGAVVVAACGRIGFDSRPGAGVTPCSNGIRDGDETGIDCGGSCLPCVGAVCNDATGCATGSCVNGQCELASGPPFWLPGPELSTPRWGIGCATYASGTIIVTGGDAGGAVATTELLAPGAPAFAAGPTMQLARVDHAAAITTDDTLYVYGGNGPAPADTSIEALVAGTFSPRTGTTLTHSRIGGAGGVDGKFYVVDSDGMWIYTPSSDSWFTGAPSNNGRDSSGVTRGPDGLIYAIGGRINVTGEVFVDAWDTGLGVWRSRADLHVSRMYPGVVTAGDGRIYAIGGTQSDGTATATAEAYTPDRDLWLDVAPATLARNGACAALGGDGRIYVAGGSTGGGSASPLPTVEVYGPIVSLSPATAAPGDTVSVTGSNFAANAGVSIAFDGAPLASGTSDDTGSVSLDFTVPAAASGSHTIIGIDGKSQFPTTAPLTVP